MRGRTVQVPLTEIQNLWLHLHLALKCSWYDFNLITFTSQILWFVQVKKTIKKMKNLGVIVFSCFSIGLLHTPFMGVLNNVRTQEKTALCVYLLMFGDLEQSHMVIILTHVVRLITHLHLHSCLMWSQYNPKHLLRWFDWSRLSDGNLITQNTF